MRRNRLAYARELVGFLAGLLHRVFADVPTGDVAGKQPVAGFVHSPPSAQDLQQSGREHYVTILLAFALVDMDDHALAIDVGGFQTYRLGDAQTSSVAGSQDCAVLGAVDAAEKLQDLLRA
jgi:hypothetical protein